MKKLKAKLLRDIKKQSARKIIASLRESGLDVPGSTKYNRDEVTESDVLVVHRNTDAPQDDESPLSEAEVTTVLNRGGIYIEYTKGRVGWNKEGERRYFGSHSRVIRILSALPSPVRLEDLNFALQQAAAQFENLVVLSILCQAYLAAHGGSGLNGWEDLEMEVKSRVVSSTNRDQISEPSRWCDVLSRNDDWQTRLRQEADEQARLQSCPEEAQRVKDFIEVLEDSRELSGFVEPAYQATRRLLGEA
jgi:hypothetical protein